jgi:hypothetical protein
VDTIVESSGAGSGQAGANWGSKGASRQEVSRLEYARASSQADVETDGGKAGSTRNAQRKVAQVCVFPTRFHVSRTDFSIDKTITLGYLAAEHTGQRYRHIPNGEQQPWALAMRKTSKNSLLVDSYPTPVNLQSICIW